MNAGRLGVSAEHGALHDAVRGWTERHVPRDLPRACLDGGAPDVAAVWSGIVAQGWTALPVEYGLPEAGVVLEELARALTPAPLLPSMALTAALVGLDGPADVVASLSTGDTGAVAWATEPAVFEATRLRGRHELVPGAAGARWLLVPADAHWALVDATATGVTVTARPPTDVTRPVADVELDGVEPHTLLVDPDGVVAAAVVRLWCADALGAAAWCVETAATYATVREQFGQPIGRFQGVKHRCADMLCAVELARAATWDALRAPLAGEEGRLATAVAAALAPDALLTAAKGGIQVLGGIGFTWEHDAHLYLKRALATSAHLGAAHWWRSKVVEQAAGGTRRAVTVDLPPEAETSRGAVRDELAALATRDKSEWRALLADGGWITPHWPRPWGRDASPVEQLLIDEELAAAHIRRPHLQVGAWVLPTILAHGTEAQQERYIRPTLRGEISWCQLFSEPGAGSDLASLSTKASRVEGGWMLTGQKVWTSMAADATYGLCLARTDPTVARHDGITAFVVDMATPGIELRPLRELTGQAMFFEVFLADVFVADDDVIGPEGGGWVAARTTLANERVSMGSGSSFGLGVEMVLGLLGPDLSVANAVEVDRVGTLLVDAEALAVLGARMTLRSLEGSAAEPGPEASVRKLLGVEHEQRTQETGMGLLHRGGLADDGATTGWLYGFLANRCLSIAGGTSEIQRNVIAERLLGLPRD